MAKKKLSKAVELQLKQELTKGIADVAEVTITIPLSNITKKIHTRMFIKTKFSTPELQNMGQLGKIFMANAYFYNSQYVKNVWFVKKTKVSVTPTGESMTLTLSPFNDSYESEANTLKGLTEQKNKTKTSNGDNGKNSVSNVQVCTDDAFLKEIVQKAIGTKTDPEEMAFALYDYYNENHVYSWDSTAVEDDYNRGFRSLWEQHGQSCGPGAACLFYMFKCVGLHPKIMNGHNHYWIMMDINGKTYYCDHAGAEGAQNSRRIGTSTGNDTVWEGANGGDIRMEA